MDQGHNVFNRILILLHSLKQKKGKIERGISKSFMWPLFLFSLKYARFLKL